MLLSHQALRRANLTSSLRLAVFVCKVRRYSTPSPRNKSKVWSSVDHAVHDIKSGSVLLCGGEQSLARTSHKDIFEIRFWLGWHSRLMLLPLNYGKQSVLYQMSDTLLGALAKRKDVKDLIGVSNNSGGDDSGLGELLKYTLVDQYLTNTEDKLINTNQLSKIIASYPGRSNLFLYIKAPCSKLRFLGM